MIDAFGRKINYLRLSVTDRCNLRCQYCMPEEGIEKRAHNEILRIEDYERLVGALIEMGIDKIRLTGGEPLVRGGIMSLIKHIGGDPRVKDFAMTTNGILLSKMAKDLKEAGLNRVNISIDSLKEDRYALMTRGGKLSDVLKGIEAAKREGLTPIKLNVVLVGGFNEDEIEDFVALTKDDAIDVRFIELMPIGEVARWNVGRYLSNDVVLQSVPDLIPMHPEDVHSPARYYKLPGAAGRIGLISPISCSFCRLCNRIRLTSDGKLKYCLHADDELDLSKVISSQTDMIERIEAYLMKKPESHRLNQGTFVRRNMFQIGG